MSTVDPHRSRADLDLVLLDIEYRTEQIRQSRQQQAYEPWKVVVAALTAGAALLGAGAALGALLTHWR
jgi:hypothetical protein